MHNASVVDLEIQKGGFSHWCAKRPRKFWVETPTFGHVKVICALLIWPPFLPESSLHMAYYRTPRSPQLLYTSTVIKLDQSRAGFVLNAISVVFFLFKNSEETTANSGTTCGPKPS